MDTFLEVGPQSVLTAMAADVLPDDDAVLAVAVQRRDRPEAHALLHALAELHVHGVPVTWTQWFTDTGARRVDLPTYAFQHQRYWPTAGRARTGDVSGAGLGRTGHPLLGATVDLAGDDEMVLTGRLSLTTHPWLADHTVSGLTLVPGTALVELAVRAGDEVGLSRLRELTMAAPLALPGTGGVRIQVRVSTSESPQRPVAVYSRPDDDPEAGWTRHAEGVLEPSTADEPDPVTWPPAGAAEVDLANWYPTLAEHGLTYGPAFQGLRRAWTGGDEVYAEVVLPDDATEAAGFGVHPALLDAALHPIGLLLGGEEPGGPRVPFAFEGVQVHASGAGALRVRLTRDGSGLRLAAYDEVGAPVVSVDSLALRELTGVAAPGVATRSLFELRWPAVQAAPAGELSGWALVTGGLELPAPVGMPTYADVATVAGEESVPRTLLLPVFPAPGAATAGVGPGSDLGRAGDGAVLARGGRPGGLAARGRDPGRGVDRRRRPGDRPGERGGVGSAAFGAVGAPGPHGPRGRRRRPGRRAGCPAGRRPAGTGRDRRPVGRPRGCGVLAAPGPGRRHGGGDAGRG